MGNNLSYFSGNSKFVETNNKTILHESGYYDNWQFFKGYEF